MSTTDPKKRALVWYHANCTDGLVAAWAAVRGLEARGYTADAMPVTYEEFKTELGIHTNTSLLRDYAEGVLYIVDFSVPVALLPWLESMMPSLGVTIIDHHKTAFEMYFPGLEVTEHTAKKGVLHGAVIELDNAECGASLTYMHFNPGEDLPLLIEYVADRDLWTGNYGDDTHILAHWLRETAPGIAELDFICDRVEAQDPTLWEEAVDMYEQHKLNVEEAVVNAKYMSIDGYRGMVTTAGLKGLASDVGSILAVKSGTFGAYVIVEQDGGLLVSLRSRGEIDVSAIAKRYGGGGHKNAAGFRLAANNTSDMAVAIHTALSGEYND